MDGMSVNVLDLVVAGVVLLSAILAFFRGFVHEVLAVAAWIGAALAALYGLPHLQPHAREIIPVTWAADAAAAASIFLVTLLVLALITRAISKRVQESALNALDRSLGFLFGVVRGGAIVAVAFIVFSWMFPVQDERPLWVVQARSLPLMEQGAEMVRSLVPAELLGEEEKARAAAREAERKAGDLIEAKKMYEKLTQPRPVVAPASPTQGPPPPAYGETERQGLDRLFESNQQR